MPLANVHVLAGHPRPVLKQLLHELSLGYAELLGAPMDRLQVWVTEVDPELYAIAGTPADELLAEGERAGLEIPFVRLILMAGRPESQVRDAIELVTEIVARNLGGDPSRVRVAVERVPADHWGIGGVQASILRRAELEARQKAS